MFDCFSCEQGGGWGAAPREDGRGGFQGRGGSQARPTRYQATGANGTPLGTPQRMSPVSAPPPEPEQSAIPMKPMEDQPPKDSAPEISDIKSKKKSKSESKPKDKKVSTQRSFLYLRCCVHSRKRHRRIPLLLNHNLCLHPHHLKRWRKREGTRNTKSPLMTKRPLWSLLSTLIPKHRSRKRKGNPRRRISGKLLLLRAMKTTRVHRNQKSGRGTTGS
jgi:hypothetical protein